MSEQGIDYAELERFFNLALDLMVLANTDGYFLRLNHAWEPCLGYAKGELEGRRFYDFVHPDDIEATRQATQRLAEQEPILNFVNRFRTLNGDYRYIEWRAQAYGKMIYAAGRDITEHYLTLERLAESDRLFRALFEQSNDAVFIFDLAGNNQVVNQKAADLLGYTMDEMMHLGTPEISAEVDKTRAVLQRLLAGEKIPPYERLFRHKDGSLIPIEANIELVRDEQGRPKHFQSIVRDISERKAAELQLRSSEQQFRALFEQSNDAVFILDFEGRHRTVNQKASELLGYSIEELQMMRASDISAEPSQSSNVLEQLLAGETIDPYERLFRHKTGRLIPVEINVELVRDNNAQPMHIQSVVRDISRRKANEEIIAAQRESEQIFQAYLKRLHEIVIELSHITVLDTFYRRAVELGLEEFGFERMGFLLYDAPNVRGTYGTDPYGEITDERDLRLDPTALTSILWRTMQHENRFLFEEDAELYSQLELIGHGQNAVAVLWNGTEKLGWLAVDNAVHKRPISPAQLDILALYALSLGNLLAQKLAQTRLEESEARYRSVIAALSEGIILQDANGVLITCNEAAQRILGLSADEMLGRTSFDPRWRAIHEDGSDFVGAEHPTMLSLRTGVPYNDVIMGIHKPNGELVWLSMNSQALIHPNETKPHAVVVSFVDITKRKNAERQALELALEKERIKVLRNFIQGSSHEFRTPLSIIKSNVYFLQRSDDPAKRAEKAASVDVQIQRILGLLNMLNKMSELDTFITMKLKKISIQQLFADLLLELSSEIARKALQVTVSGVDGKIYGNEEFLSDAFEQLIRNAIQFSHEGGTIRILGSQEGQRYYIAIEDEGIGMDDLVLPHIFERFYRLDSAHSKAGFGLGLPLAQNVIERHGGEIRVQSKLGQGSRFEVWLPLNA